VTATHLARWIAAAIAALAAGGCGTSTPPHYYTLDSTATEDAAVPAASYGVMVGPVSVPASVDRPEIVIQVEPNRVAIDEFHRWAAPLGEAIARTVAGDLAALLRSPDVAVAPFANFAPSYRVTINVQRFDSRPGDSVLVEAVWAVRKTAGGETRSGRTVAREVVEGKGFDALAAAHSRALAYVSADIAAAIRAEAGAP
jgi:uncharacterized lipoprotein YmbA